MYSLSKEQREIKQAAREFAEGEFRAVARELDEKATFDPRLWKKAAELGFLAVFINEQYEGMGMGYLDQCIIIEEFARVDLGITHAQFNVVDRETLIDAQHHPDEHKHLVVRVAGYSAYFADLSRDLQDLIIARTEQAL